MATLKELSVDDLVNILSKIENNQVEQYTKLFEYSEKALEFENDALVEIAKTAKTLGTGARSLKTIMENVLLESMFNLDDAKITVDDVKKLQSQMGKDPEAETN
jgi:ATP-dependent Clp protease ATP-binding subunit ClpX